MYFTGGDVESLSKARHARVVVATARELPTLMRSGVELDALVASATDAGERYEPGDLDPPPRLFVATSGRLGGWAQPGGPFEAADPPAPIEDTYGAGRLLRGGPHVRARPWRRAARRARPRCESAAPRSSPAAARTAGS